MTTFLIGAFIGTATGIIATVLGTGRYDDWLEKRKRKAEDTKQCRDGRKEI